MRKSCLKPLLTLKITVMSKMAEQCQVDLVRQALKAFILLIIDFIINFSLISLPH